jgi:hypothetical protein
MKMSKKIPEDKPKVIIDKPEEREPNWPPPKHEEELEIQPLPDDLDPEPWKKEIDNGK